MRQTFLPFAQPDLDGSEIARVVEVLQGGWLTTGPRTREFETRFAEFVGSGHAVAVNSCTAAMQLALESVGVGPGTEVITSPYTFAATAAVIQHLGGTPVFADVLPDTLTIDPVEVERRCRHGLGRLCPFTWRVTRRKWSLVIAGNRSWVGRGGRLGARVPLEVSG